LNKIIEFHHKQLDWDAIPTIEKCIKRFESKSMCLLFYYNNQCIGWNWANKDARFNWIDLDQILEENEIYLGGMFVTNVIERPADAGLYNYNMVFDYWFKTNLYDTIYGYCDDWNRTALRVNFLNGHIIYNWIKK